MKVFWVSKRLAFGSAITTWQHVEKLQALGVTHVINLRHGKHDKKVRQFKSLWLPFRDDKEPRPRVLPSMLFASTERPCESLTQRSCACAITE